MLAARIDQENDVRARQTAAATKSLSQGVKGLGARTPDIRAAKTPFVVALNDENGTVGGVKRGLTTKSLGPLGRQQGLKTERNALQTPAARHRPALGFRTTNAKAIAFQTPAPKNAGHSTEKTTRKTAGRSKIQVHKEEAQPEQQEPWANREIEYIPPRPVALPDIASDEEWTGKIFSVLKGKNLTKGWAIGYFHDSSSQWKADDAHARKEEQGELDKECDNMTQELLDMASEYEYEIPVKKQIKAVSTLASRSAAKVLSEPSKPLPSYAAPTASVKAKASSSINLGHKITNSITTAPAGKGRAATCSTLGYAKGRAVSGAMRKSSDEVLKDETSVKPKKRDTVKELEDMVYAREYGATDIAYDNGPGFGRGGVSLYYDDDEDDEDDEGIFQLTGPDD